MKFIDDMTGSSCPNCEAPMVIEFTFRKGTTLRQVATWEASGVNEMQDRATAVVAQCPGCGYRDVIKG